MISELAEIAVLHEHLLDVISDGALVCDAQGTVVWANPAVLEVLGVTDDLRRTRLAHWFSDGKKIDTLIADGPSIHGQVRSVVANAVGNGSDTLVTAHPGPSADAILIVLRPFRSVVSSFDRAISFATRDPVTRLLTRGAFQERLASDMRLNPAGVLICVNVNQLSMVNEAYGNAEGDGLLRIVGQRLRSVSPSEKPVARLYGGRFALLLTAPDAGRARELASEQAEALHRALIDPVALGGGAQPVTLSIGLAAWPDDSTTAEDLLSAAEGAIYALSQGGGTRWFEQAIHSQPKPTSKSSKP